MSMFKEPAQTLWGLRVVVQDNEMTKRPKLQLTKGLCTPKFEAEMNAWLLDRFGYEYQCYNLGNETLIVHSDVLEKIKEECV